MLQVLEFKFKLLHLRFNKLLSTLEFVSTDTQFLCDFSESYTNIRWFMSLERFDMVNSVIGDMLCGWKSFKRKREKIEFHFIHEKLTLIFFSFVHWPNRHRVSKKRKLSKENKTSDFSPYISLFNRVYDNADSVYGAMSERRRTTSKLPSINYRTAALLRELMMFCYFFSLCVDEEDCRRVEAREKKEERWEIFNDDDDDGTSIRAVQNFQLLNMVKM